MKQYDERDIGISFLMGMGIGFGLFAFLFIMAIGLKGCM